MKALDPTKGWYSAQELAGLPGMPGTDRRVRSTAEKNLWTTRTKARGKGTEYALRSLPEATQRHILGLAFAAPAALPLPAESAPLPSVQSPANAVTVRGQVRRRRDETALDDAQRGYRDGALVLCRAIEAAMAATGCSLKRACRELAERLVCGQTSPELQDAASITYVKPRRNAPLLGGLDAQTARLQKMMGFFEKGRLAGDVGLFLVAGKREKEGHNPVHVAAFLRFYCLPTRPPVSEAYRNMKPWLAERGIDTSTVTRIEQSLPVIVKYRGRVTGSEWRGLKPYVDRDVSMFHANDIWVGDGHSYKAKVQHPIHGQPFTPEITFIIDWVSRKIVGWSVALSESTVAVSDAFRHAQITTRARPLVYYSDNGSGQTGKMIDCPIAGTLARQGIAHETGIPGNPQGRGILERLWQVTLIPLARTYPTCTWRGSDQNATTKMLKLLNRKDQGGITIPSFRQLLDDVERTVRTYNLEHEHRELSGNTPEDEYQARIDRDSIVFGPTDSEIHALWMPEVVRKPQRGKVSLFGNEYFKRDLVDVLREGQKVRVRYDLHNADKVWLLTMEGVFLGEAAWNGNHVAAFPVPKMDKLRADRAAGKIRRGEEIIKEAQAELGDVIDLAPAVTMPVAQPDYMPVPVECEDAGEPEKTMSHEDMVMWLYGQKDADDEEDGSGAASGETLRGAKSRAKQCQKSRRATEVATEPSAATGAID